jgi:hypothetical protein
VATKPAAPVYRGVTRSLDISTAFDLAQLELPADLKPARLDKSPLVLGFSTPKTSPDAVSRIARQMIVVMEMAGWAVDAAAGPTEVSDAYATTYFSRDGLVTYLSAGASRGSEPGSEVVNLSLMQVGGLDARSLPRIGDAPAPPDAGFKRIIYSVPQKRDEIRAFHSKALAALGWREHDPPSIPGVPSEATNPPTQQQFFQSGLGLTFYYSDAEGGRTRIIGTLSVLGTDLPVPPSAKKLELDGSAPSIFYTTTEPVDAIRAYYEAEMKALGWTAAEAPIGPEEIISLRLEFTAPGREPLQLSYLPDPRLSFVALGPKP